MKLRFAFQFFKADLRNGDLTLLMAALFLCVFLVSGMGVLIERMQLMLIGESSQFLAADRSLSSPRPVDVSWLKKAENMNIETAKFIAFQSMLYFQDEPLLVSAKASNDPYPLKGKLKYRKEYFGTIFETVDGPEPGEVWLEARALQRLDADIGAIVYLGDAEFTVTAELVSEPDRGMAAFSLGPRALLHLRDVEKTGVVQTGSRINYRYLFKAEKDSLDEFYAWVSPKFEESHKWLDLESSQPQIAKSLQRAKSFFILASTFIVILSAIALSMASSRYAKRHIQHVAVLKTLGATSSQIYQLFLMLLLLILCVVSAAGLMVAFMSQQALIEIIANSRNIPVPVMVFSPFSLGLFVAFVAISSFTVPQFFALTKVSAMNLFRQENMENPVSGKSSFLLALCGLFIILWMYSKNVILVAALLLSLAMLVPVLFFLTKTLLRFLLTMVSRSQMSLVLRLVFRNIQRSSSSNAIQVVVMTISLSLLVVLIALQDNLFEQWKAQLPEKAPNYFLLNIQTHELEEAQLWLAENRFSSKQLFPMVRGRLTEINGRSVREFVSKEEFKRSGADRELNLSWSPSLPEANEIVEGDWIKESASDVTEVSVESRLAEKLNIKMGDELTFQITADKLHAKVTSLRQVDWNTMQPNFYMLLQSEALEPYSKTFMTSFYLPPERSSEIVSLLKKWPTFVLIDVNSLIYQIRSVVSQVSEALNWVLALVFVSGLLVLIATVQSSLDQRIRENVILRAIGASRALIYKSLLAEFAILAIISGVLATIVSEVVVLLLQSQLFSLPLTLNPSLWPVAPVLALVLWLLTVLLSCKKVVTEKPAALLKSL